VSKTSRSNVASEEALGLAQRSRHGEPCCGWLSAQPRSGRV